MATKKGNGKSNCRSKTAKNASKTGAETTEKKGGGTSLAPVKKGEVNKPKKDIFANASQISITKNSIIVTEKEAKTVNGCFIKRKVTFGARPFPQEKYRSQAPAPLRCAQCRGAY